MLIRIVIIAPPLDSFSSLFKNKRPNSPVEKNVEIIGIIKADPKREAIYAILLKFLLCTI